MNKDDMAEFLRECGLVVDGTEDWEELNTALRFVKISIADGRVHVCDTHKK